MPDLTADQKMRLLEIAVSSVQFPYKGGSAPTYEDKSMKEIIARADRFSEYVTGKEADDTRTLIGKLRGVLCERD